MAKESAPSVHPCIEHGHNNKHFTKPVGTYMTEEGKFLGRYSVKECTTCGQQVAYDHVAKEMVPIANVFKNIPSVHLPDYLQESYIDWLKFRENSTHST